MFGPAGCSCCCDCCGACRTSCKGSCEDGSVSSPTSELLCGVLTGSTTGTGLGITTWRAAAVCVVKGPIAVVIGITAMSPKSIASSGTEAEDDRAPDGSEVVDTASVSWDLAGAGDWVVAAGAAGCSGASRVARVSGAVAIGSAVDAAASSFTSAISSADLTTHEQCAGPTIGADVFCWAEGSRCTCPSLLLCATCLLPLSRLPLRCNRAPAGPWCRVASRS